MGADRIRGKVSETHAGAKSQPALPRATEPAGEPEIGPVQEECPAPIGPSLPPMESIASLDEPDSVSASASAPSSPYSANRALLRDLTLPTVPDLDIPPSPPGSPDPGASQKFEQFLDLKKKGTHFNLKLEQSSALRNPSLMDKLLAFVEVDGLKQYETTLSTDLWDPKAFPASAYREGLRKSMGEVAKEREMERASAGRSSIEFVPSGTAGEKAAGAELLMRGGKRKGDWR